MRVNIDSKLFFDPRFLSLVKPNRNRFEVIGKLVCLWHHCAEFVTSTTTKKNIDVICECEGFAEELLSCGLAKIVEEENDENKIKISGVEERIEWVKRLRAVGRKGGKQSAKGNHKLKHMVEHMVENVPSKRSTLASKCANPLTLTTTHTHTHTHTKERKPPPTDSQKFSPEDLQFSNRWIESLWDGKGHISAEAGAETIRKLREVDGYSIADLEAALEFVRQDDFWKNNAISPAGLRTKGKNSMMKIQNIMAKLRQDPEAIRKAKRAEEVRLHNERVNAMYPLVNP